MEYEVVVAGTRDFQRIELEEAEPFDDVENRLRVRGQGPRRGQEMALDEEPSGMVGGDGTRHGPDRTASSGQFVSGTHRG